MYVSNTVMIVLFGVDKSPCFRDVEIKIFVTEIEPTAGLQITYVEIRTHHCFVVRKIDCNLKELYKMIAKTGLYIIIHKAIARRDLHTFSSAHFTGGLVDSLN